MGDPAHALPAPDAGFGEDAPPEAVRRAADAGRRSFLRMVGHELRTPLNSIIGFSEIISRELYGPISEPRYREHAEIIRDSGLKLLKLVNQVMEIVRLESGAVEFDLAPEPPAVLVEEAIKGLAEEARARGVTLRPLGVGPLRPVLADARALNTILTALIQNAIRYSPEGGEVIVRARMAGRAVLFEVRDHGPGVAPEQVARLLRPFEQGEEALTRHGEGAGLGLTLVKLLTEAMDGKLRIVSCEGQGLTAIVRLPAA